jgi:hypothetical protein
MDGHMNVKSDVKLENFIFSNNLEFFVIVTSNLKVRINVSFLPAVVRIIDLSDG